MLTVATTLWHAISWRCAGRGTGVPHLHHLDLQSISPGLISVLCRRLQSPAASRRQPTASGMTIMRLSHPPPTPSCSVSAVPGRVATATRPSSSSVVCPLSHSVPVPTAQHGHAFACLTRRAPLLIPLAIPPTAPFHIGRLAAAFVFCTTHPHQAAMQKFP